MNKAGKTAGVPEPGSELGSTASSHTHSGSEVSGTKEGHPAFRLPNSSAWVRSCLWALGWPEVRALPPGSLPDVLPSHSYPQFMPENSSLSFSPVLLHYNTHPKILKVTSPKSLLCPTLSPASPESGCLQNMERQHGTIFQLCAPQHHLLSLNLISYLNNGAHLLPSPPPLPAKGRVE